MATTSKAVPANVQELLDAGADFVGGTAFLDRREVGRWQDGEFYLDPGNEDLIAEHKARVKADKARVLENARLAAEAVQPAPKVGKSTTVTVPENPPTISIEEAATKQNSIPGQGPRNPVRVDGDNNRTPEVAPDAEPQSAEEVLRALDNPEGAAAVAQGVKEAAGTGTELASTKGAGKTK